MRRIERLIRSVQILMGAVYLISGLPKVAGVGAAVGKFEEYGFPGWFVYVTGVCEVLGGAGLWLGIARPVATIVAGVVLVPTMIVGAFVQCEHPNDSDILAVPPALLVGLLSGLVLRAVWLVHKHSTAD